MSPLHLRLVERLSDLCPVSQCVAYSLRLRPTAELISRLELGTFWRGSLHGVGGPACTILPQAKFFVDLAA